MAAAARPISLFSARANCAAIAGLGFEGRAGLSLLDQGAAMGALKIATLLEMLEIAPHCGRRGASRIGQFLNRCGPALPNVFQHQRAPFAQE